jgi:hypothetical protein
VVDMDEAAAALRRADDWVDDARQKWLEGPAGDSRALRRLEMAHAAQAQAEIAMLEIARANPAVKL